MTDGTVYHYTYDAAGNITSVTKNNETTAFATYVYDGLGQLIRENRRELNKTYVYSYDIDGNILSKTEYAYTIAETPSDAADTKTYGYSYVNGLYSLTSVNDGTITYDASGNPLTYYNGMTFTWKDGRKLASVSGENVSTSYVYNGDGLRTQKGVFDGTNLYSVNYFYEDSKLMALEKYNGKTTDYMFFMYDQSDNIVGFEFNDTAYYYIKNMQGDVIGILDSTGNTVVKYSYTAWGELMSVTDGNGNAITDTTSLAYLNPIRYRGYVYDDEIGLYYVSSRYYDPEVGRFLNSDEAIMLFLGQEEVLGNNLFSYCENCPTTNVDLWGYVKINIKWLGTAIDLIIWLIPALFAISKIWKTVSKSANKLVSFGNKLISVGKQLFKRFDDRLYCAFAKESTYRIVRTIGVLAGIITIISSIGSIVQYIIDILDGKWDGYLNTNRFGPKLDLTRDY